MSAATIAAAASAVVTAAHILYEPQYMHEVRPAHCTRHCCTLSVIHHQPIQDLMHMTNAVCVTGPAPPILSVAVCRVLHELEAGRCRVAAYATYVGTYLTLITTVEVK